MLIGLALIAYPLYLGVKAYQLPAIYDITTDPIDPPRFDAIARLRPRDANPIAYAGLYAAELQHDAYSDIEPDRYQCRAAGSLRRGDEGHHQAQMARGRRAPAARHRRRRDGLIEAIARTPILGFRDDVVVRMRADRTTARASTCARRRATAATISAPMRRGCAT